MAKFYGMIGYVETVETKPGVWSEKITERPYTGDITRNSYRFQSSDTLNDDVTITNNISIIADPFADDNVHIMRYVKFRNAKWKITNVDIQRPRLILTVGGVYNGEQA